MASKVTRRQFLKISGAGLLLLSGCTANLQRPVWMEPYVRAPEETLPGEDFWFASTCRMCPAGCGILVRVSNGRARKIEGNPAHPLNQGRLCARGQAGLQLLYHPDRLRHVLKRTGERGQGRWGRTTWEQIVEELAQQIQGMAPERIAFLTGLLPDYQATLVARFLKGLGAPPAVVYDTQAAFDGRVVLEAASQALFDVPVLPIFDIARADVVYAFGSNFLETWLSPVVYNRAYGRMRSQPGVRGMLIAFAPRLSMTAANADRWVPVPPGTEGLVALALGKIIVDEGWDKSNAELRGFYEGVDVGAVAQATGVPAEELVQFARRFAEAHHPVAMPGDLLAGSTNGLEATQAVEALNLVLGHLGEHGAIFLTPSPPSRDLRKVPVSPFQAVRELVDRMAAGEVDALFVLGANPVYELPAALGFTDALKNVQLVVTFASMMDETAALSDIVLPAHTYLETWGYEFVSPSTDRLIVSAQQPVVRPLYDTRDPGDVLLALADKLGGKVARRLPWPNLVHFIQTRLTSLQLLEGNIAAQDAKTFWAYWLQHGGWWSKEQAWQVPEPSQNLSAKRLLVPSPEFDGEASQYPLHLLPVPSVTFGDGRHAGLPWLQETPDPMTTATWDTWVELNPATAERLGVKHDEIVKVTSPFGEIEAVVYVFPGIHPDVVAVPVGQGHSAMGRWAEGRGANVLRILAPRTVPSTGQLAWAATRVRVTKTGRRRVLPRLESNIGVDRARERGVVPG